MKLVYPDYGLQFDFSKQNCFEWIIENPVVYRTVIYNLKHQQFTNEGNLVISENDEILKFDKMVDIIYMPIGINIQNRKIITRVSDQINDLAMSEKYYMTTQELYSNLKRYFYQLEMDLDVDIAINEEVDFSLLEKAMGVCLEQDETDFWDCLIKYLSLQTKLINIKLFIFINLKSFSSSEEIDKLVELCNYNNWKTLLLENTNSYDNVDLKRIVLDYDQCVIF